MSSGPSTPTKTHPCCVEWQEMQTLGFAVPVLFVGGLQTAVTGLSSLLALTNEGVNWEDLP